MGCENGKISFGYNSVVKQTEMEIKNTGLINDSSSVPSNYYLECKISGYHNGDSYVCCLLGCDNNVVR
jgi:hypothetical protein